MEATVAEQKETTIRERKKRKRSVGSLILNFLMYGGWLAVLIVGMAIYVALSIK